MNKRIRITDRVLRESRNCYTRMAMVYSEAVKHGTPLNEASAEARAIRTERVWPPSIAWDLYQRGDSLREFLVLSQANWVIYLDGLPTTSNAISAKRSAGDDNVWQRAHGRHEWRSNPGKPFYVDEAPQCIG